MISSERCKATLSASRERTTPVGGSSAHQRLIDVHEIEAEPFPTKAIFDIDPDIEAVTAFPLQTEYWSATSDGDAVKRIHIPDDAIRMRNGGVICVDYVPVAIQDEKPRFTEKTEQLLVY